MDQERYRNKWHGPCPDVCAQARCGCFRGLPYALVQIAIEIGIDFLAKACNFDPDSDIDLDDHDSPV